MNRLHLIAIGAALSACAPKVPPELAEARTAYARASSGPAAELVPADVHKAAVALEEAEAAFADEPRDAHTLDLAYVAQRKSQLAEVLADSAQARKTQDDATKQIIATQGEQLDAAGQQVAEAKQAAADADSRTAAALSQLAAVQREPRGLVITLSGSVLFASDESTLLPEAQTRLQQVTATLVGESDQRPLVVEGHTDDQGSDDYNLALSQRRAEAVASFLVSQGYDQSLVQARGIGETRPVADNTSAEGRANNRRVEIIVGQSPAM